MKNLHCIMLRITPADAGKTRHGFIVGVFFQDHPRGCGENSVVNMRTDKPIGSPPRMRGKLSADILIQPCVRITPADAGKTPLCVQGFRLA